MLTKTLTTAFLPLVLAASTLAFTSSPAQADRDGDRRSDRHSDRGHDRGRDRYDRGRGHDRDRDSRFSFSLSLGTVWSNCPPPVYHRRVIYHSPVVYSERTVFTTCPPPVVVERVVTPAVCPPVVGYCTPGYYTTQWIEPVYETRYDSGGRALRVLIQAGCYKQVWVAGACYTSDAHTCRHR